MPGWLSCRFCDRLAVWSFLAVFGSFLAATVISWPVRCLSDCFSDWLAVSVGFRLFQCFSACLVGFQAVCNDRLAVVAVFLLLDFQ